MIFLDEISIPLPSWKNVSQILQPVKPTAGVPQSTAFSRAWTALVAAAMKDAWFENDRAKYIIDTTILFDTDSGTIADGTTMTLRLDDASKAIGTLKYNEAANLVAAHKDENADKLTYN